MMKKIILGMMFMGLCATSNAKNIYMATACADALGGLTAGPLGAVFSSGMCWYAMDRVIPTGTGPTFPPPPTDPFNPFDNLGALHNQALVNLIPLGSNAFTEAAIAAELQRLGYNGAANGDLSSFTPGTIYTDQSILTVIRPWTPPPFYNQFAQQFTDMYNTDDPESIYEKVSELSRMTNAEGSLSPENKQAILTMLTIFKASIYLTNYPAN